MMARRLAVLGSGHLGMLAVMFILLEKYQPEPNGFRLHNVGAIGSFAVLTIAPVLIGMGARRFISMALISLLHMLSPLLLLGNMRNRNSDLDFAILLWWFPLPAVAGLVVIIDRLVGS